MPEGRDHVHLTPVSRQSAGGRISQDTYRVVAALAHRRRAGRDRYEREGSFGSSMRHRLGEQRAQYGGGVARMSLLVGCDQSPEPPLIHPRCAGLGKAVEPPGDLERGGRLQNGTAARTDPPPGSATPWAGRPQQKVRRRIEPGRHTLTMCGRSGQASGFSWGVDMSRDCGSPGIRRGGQLPREPIPAEAVLIEPDGPRGISDGLA